MEEIINNIIVKIEQKSKKFPYIVKLLLNNDNIESLQKYLGTNLLNNDENVNVLNKDTIEWATKYLIRSLDTNFHNIPNSFKIAKQRNYNKTYWFFDIHSTILKPDYNNVAKIYYPMAKEVLQKLSNRPDICICLYTCSYPEEIKDYLTFFENDNIVFEYTNRNPEASNTKHGFFEDKPYMNVLFEDKAGFDADVDWYIVNNLIDEYAILK